MPSAWQSAFEPQATSAQVVAQQTFVVPAPVATQWPMAHSPSALQLCPSASGALHSPPMHVKPAAQADGLPEQLTAHTPAEQR